MSCSSRVLVCVGCMACWGGEWGGGGGGGGGGDGGGGGGGDWRFGGGDAVLQVLHRSISLATHLPNQIPHEVAAARLGRVGVFGKVSDSGDT